MALQFILDGYNILQQMPELMELKLETARHQLIALIERQRPQGSPRNKVTIVFDGRADVFCDKVNVSTVKVVFSHYDSADEEIKRRVSAIRLRKSVVVVTDDRAIQYFIRALGAQSWSVQQFLSRIPGAPGRSHKPRQSPDSEKKLDPGQASEINAEILRLWERRKKDDLSC